MSLNINAAHSTSYYLKNFYSSNKSAAKTESYRSNSSSHTLLLADSEALKKAASALSDMDYDSTEESDSGDIYNSITAFVTAYNNFMDSSGSSDYSYIKNQKNKIKDLVNEHSDEFEKIGITISTKGKLEIDDDKLEKTKLSKLKKLFSSEGDFCNSLGKYATKILKYAKNHVPQKSVSSENTPSETDTLDVSSMADLTNSLIGSNVDLTL